LPGGTATSENQVEIPLKKRKRPKKHSPKETGELSGSKSNMA
jgi:hypothetical protein